MTVDVQGGTVCIRSEDIVMGSYHGEERGDIARFRKDVQLHLLAPTHAPGKVMAVPGATAGAAPADTREVVGLSSIIALRCSTDSDR